MPDPSERFNEILDCGCELAQGTWFYCVAHQAKFARPVTAADLSEVPKALAQPEPAPPWETQP